MPAYPVVISVCASLAVSNWKISIAYGMNCSQFMMESAAGGSVFLGANS